MQELTASTPRCSPAAVRVASRFNEAFAAPVLACTIECAFGADNFERLNVNGSGISLGHPVGAMGARILATLSREMVRRGAATVFRR